ncbi:MAG: PrsW family intramembrane metalloprotease [Chloroflexi bacterium]|nr:PrsW family intramembrane metalloprotease [Chloroflexota bacterium]
MIEDTVVERMPQKWRILGPLVAMLGGLFGILAAGHENSGYGLYVAAFVVAPIVEESVKPCGVYWLLGRRPFALPSQQYTVFLTALAGLTFGIIESLVYVGIYYREYDELDHTFVIWRFTVCLLVHTTCSFIVGWGINEKLVAWVRGEDPFLQGNRKFFFTAMAIHSCYNIFAWIISEKTDLFPDSEDALIPFGFIW